MKRQPYQAILFDLDDTLTATSAAFQKTYRDFSEQYPDIYLAGNEEEIAAVRHIIYHISRHEREQKDMLYPSFCEKWRIWNAPPTEREFEAEWRKRQCENLTLFPWSVDVLDDLKQKGVRMSLVTNGWSRFQRMKLENDWGCSFQRLFLMDLDEELDWVTLDDFNFMFRAMFDQVVMEQKWQSMARPLHGKACRTASS